MSNNHIPNQIFFDKLFLIDEYEIINQISKLKNSFSPGLDGITIELIKAHKYTLTNIH